MGDEKRVFKALKDLQFRTGAGGEEHKVKAGSLVPVELADELAESWLQDGWIDEVKKPSKQQQAKVQDSDLNPTPQEQQAEEASE